MMTINKFVYSFTYLQLPSQLALALLRQDDRNICE
jgi:hypothetical protein